MPFAKACLAATAFACLLATVGIAGAKAPKDLVPLATPMGITVQVPHLKQGGRVGLEYEQHRFSLQYYADARGMALYTNQNDPPNQSTCYEDCAREWPPAVAPRSARAFGDWGLLKRKDGRKQWTYQGKALYTFAKDAGIGEINGVPAPTPAEEETSAKQGSSSGSSALSPWRLAAYTLASVVAPHGISVREVPDANGEALVDSAGSTLYAFDGDPDKDRSQCGPARCEDLWKPCSAAKLANPAGDFTLIDRADGITQWAYKGKALYTFRQDLATGDAKGIGIDPRWQVALVKRFYMPAQARIHEALGRGKVLASANGMTLYRRNSYIFQSTAHALPHGVAIRPGMGRAIGTRSCDAVCMKTWIPLEAPRNAQPSGFWQVLAHEDGKKQWSYKGYALYRYAGDEKPGDVKGADIYDIVTNNDLKLRPDPVTAVASDLEVSGNQIGLFWSHMYP